MSICLDGASCPPLYSQGLKLRNYRMSLMRRHAVTRRPHIRVELPVQGNWCDLSVAEKGEHIFNQLKQLGPYKKQPQMRCLCGKIVPIMFAYRCYECGAFWCPKCAGGHFGADKI